MERRLAAIFAADLVGYSRLMGADEAGTLARLKDLHAEILRPQIARCGGRIVKLMGDGLLGEFPSAVEAVDCAIDVQAALAKRETGKPADHRLMLRIGVNLGDVIAEETDIFGDGVNVAARLEGLAEPGGVCISGPVFDMIEGKLEVEFRDIGPQQVKNIARPVRAYRLVSDVAISAPASSGLARPDKPSIAALPFVSLTTEQGQDYLADGITENIITELSRFSGLFVIARNSSFAYRDQPVDMRHVATELGVRYLLKGSVRRAGARLRVAAQLLDSDDGRQVWGEKFDGDVADIFDLQDDITRNVVGSIAPQIELAEVERSRRLTGTDLNAYELALKSQGMFYESVAAADPARMDQARAVADQALSTDPNNALALSVVSLIHFYRHIYRWGEDSDADLEICGAMAERLIRVDSGNAKSYMVRAWSHLHGGDYDKALADHRRAQALNPNFAANLFAMSWSEAIMGLTDDARTHAKAAIRLSPREADIWLSEGHATLALVCLIEGDYAETLRWGHMSGQKQPILQSTLVAANAYLGDLQAARTHLAKIEGFAPDFVPTVLAGRLRLCRQDEHNAILVEGLRRAVG